MPISTEAMVRISHADVTFGVAFSRTIHHWQAGDADEDWRQYSADCGPLLLGKNCGVSVDGDCSQRISAPEGGVIHVYGDLDAPIDVDGHYEIIVTGDVTSNARIEASGFCHMFIGGRFCGQLRSASSAWVWIEDNFEGTVRTGHPSTHVFVGGDFLGRIGPFEDAALLSLTVCGFASQDSMLEIEKCGYTVFCASLGQSDAAPGLYPAEGWQKKVSGGNSFNRWGVTQRRREPAGEP